MSSKSYIEPLDHLFEEDMPESQSQINASDTLKDALKQMDQSEGRFNFITGNLAIYPPDKTYPFSYITPDIAIFPVTLTEEEQAPLNSWQMSLPNRPAPTVVFEISSEGTWQEDVGRKIRDYQLLGAHEYFAFDPQRNWSNATTQLRGWRYTSGITEEILPDNRGWLWSVELNSWLAPEGAYLRLYDPQGNLRLTRAEAERVQKEFERTRAEAERAQKEFERTRAEAERAAKEFERTQKEAERAEKEAILEKLRNAGIDINNL